MSKRLFALIIANIKMKQILMEEKNEPNITIIVAEAKYRMNYKVPLIIVPVPLSIEDNVYCAVSIRKRKENVLPNKGVTRHAVKYLINM